MTNTQGILSDHVRISDLFSSTKKINAIWISHAWHSSSSAMRISPLPLSLSFYLQHPSILCKNNIASTCFVRASCVLAPHLEAGKQQFHSQLASCMMVLKPRSLARTNKTQLRSELRNSLPRHENICEDRELPEPIRKNSSNWHLCYQSGTHYGPII